MAWIESHQELGRHPKTRRLMRQLGVSLPTAIGHLHCLWWWALDFAQEGEITKYDAEAIADAALWDGEPQMFLDAEKEIARLEGLYEGILDVDGAVGFVVIRRDGQGYQTATAVKAARLPRQLATGPLSLLPQTTWVVKHDHHTVSYQTACAPCACQKASIQGIRRASPV